MPTFKIRDCFAVAALLAAPMSLLPLSASEIPDAIAANGEILVATVQASGAQVYECKVDASGKLAWQFREPVATLFMDGKTVGRHYAGPHWEMTDGSMVSAKVSARAPGASGSDIPLLKLEVVSWRGVGQLAGVSTIQRINTKGGVAEGACETAGDILSAPYAADYAFFRKGAAAQVVSQPSVARVAPAPAPAYVASPIVVAPRPAFGIFVVRGNDHDRPKKKNPKNEPKSPPSKTPPTPKGPTAEPKAPTPLPPVVQGNGTPSEVRDHRTPRPTRGPSQPVVRDHTSASNGASGGSPSSGGKPPSGPKPGSGSNPICGISGTPPCLPK